MTRRKAIVQKLSAEPEMVEVTFSANFDWKCKCKDCGCPGVTAYKAGWSGAIPFAAYEVALAKGRLEVPVNGESSGN